VNFHLLLFFPRIPSRFYQQPSALFTGESLIICLQTTPLMNRETLSPHNMIAHHCGKQKQYRNGGPQRARRPIF
jgi:hypothetical protein